MKHLKHLKNTLATCVFHPSSSGRRRAAVWGTADCGQPATEDGGTTWQRLATLVPGLGPASGGPLSCAAVGERGGEGGRWPPALGCGGDG
jgi:hypothetical protein